MLDNSAELVSARRIPVFFAGIQTDSSGKQKLWTPEELDEAAEAYNEAVRKGLHEAPCLHGHRGKHAVGWLERAYREGRTLFVDLKNVVKEFANGIRNKLHPKRSISFYPPNHPNNPTPGRLNINHLAWLPAEGEINPAVKGLPDVSFSDFDGCLEYLETNSMKDNLTAKDAIATLFQLLRDSLIESDDLETAEKRLPQALIDRIREGDEEIFPYQEEFGDIDLKKMLLDKGVASVEGIALPRLREILDGEEPDDNEAAAIAAALGISKEIVKKNLASTTNMSERDTRLQALESQMQALLAENQRLKLEQERDRVSAFVEKLVANRKVYPADKQAKIELALSLPNDTAVEFSEGDTKISLTPRERYLQDLANGRELWSDRGMPTGPQHDPTDFNEPGLSGEFDLESVKLDARIRAKAREMGLNPNKTEDYTEAFNKLIALGQVSGI